MKKIINFNINLIHLICSILFTFIIGLMFFVDRNIDYFNSQGKILSNLIWLIPILIITFFLLKFINKESKSIFNLRNLLIAQCILLIVQIFVAYNIYFYTGWDASTIRNTAFLMIEHPEQIADTYRNYYSFHVNQTTMAILLGLIMKFFYSLNISNFYFGTVVVSVFIVNVSGLLMTLCIHKLTENRNLSFIAWLLFAILGAFSPWITIPYSDTFSMIFPILSFFLYIYLPNNKLKYISWFFIAFLSITGMLIKPQTIIVLIAIIIAELIRLLSDLTKKSIFNFLIILGIILSSNSLSNFIHKISLDYINFGIIPGRNFTYTHYLMMGLNPDTFGVYSDTDTALSYSTGSVEERESKNWNVIKERINTMGLSSYASFSAHKLLVNFNDGSFAWGGEGGFYVEIFNDKTPVSQLLKNYFYHNGTYNSIFFQMTQITWLFVLMQIPFIIFIKDKNNLSKLTIILTVLGISIFSHLFEARGRYLFLYLPFFIMLSSLSLNELKKQFYKN